MKSEKFLEAMGEIDQKYLTDVLDYQPKKKRLWYPKAGVAAAAAAVFLIASVSAVSYIKPILQDYFGESEGYKQSLMAIESTSKTKDGWTLTLTDSIADEYHVYFGIQVTAPEGTILNDERGYYFDILDADIHGIDAGRSWGCEQIEDADPNDNSVQFIMEMQYSTGKKESIDGKKLHLEIGKLYHLGDEFDKENVSWEHVYDCEQTWKFSPKITLPENSIHLEPNVPVHTLDVDAVITQVEVSPFGVSVWIEGDALKGHHSWVPENAPDGYYGCIDYQEITLYKKDGTAIPVTGSKEGSGCGGGDDPSEPGYLRLTRRLDTLVDLDSLDSISVCGVQIPLQEPVCEK